MKQRPLRAPSPALVISLIALFVALGGTTAYASGLISGRQIVNHSIPANKLTVAAVNALKGQRGPSGPGAIEVSSSAFDPRANTGRHLLATTHGVAVSYACDGNSDQLRIFLNRHHQPGHTVSITGFYARNGVVKSAIHQGIKHDGLAGRTLNLSVTVGGYDGGISRIDLSGGFSRASMGPGTCWVWGLITPSAPPSYGN